MKSILPNPDNYRWTSFIFSIHNKIFREYKLNEAKQAHIDLESRKLTGPAILIP